MNESELKTITKKHEDLLRYTTETSDADASLAMVKEFLETLARAGASIEDPQSRSQLRALIRYWASFVADKTGDFPPFQLQPFDKSQSISKIGSYIAVAALIALVIAVPVIAALLSLVANILLSWSMLLVILTGVLFTLIVWLLLALFYRRSRKASQPQQKSDDVLQKPLNLVTVQQEAGHTGTYSAALIGTAIPIPVIAALISVVIFIALPQFPALPQSLWSKLIASLGGTVLTLIFWLLVAIPYRRFTAVDLANPSSYELLLNRLSQIEAWFATLEPDPKPHSNSVYAASKQEVRSSCDALYHGLTRKSATWLFATGYVNMWRLVHCADEAFINIEPVEAVIHGALHDEMRLQNSMLKNKEDLLKKLRNAVKTLDKGAATYLSKQPPQEDETDANGAEKNNGNALQSPAALEQSSNQNPVHSEEQRDTSSSDIDETNANGAEKDNSNALQSPATLEQSSNQNPVHPEEQRDTSSSDIDPHIHARTIVREVRFTLHQFRDDRWERLVRVRNQLVRMTILTGITLYALVEFAIVADTGVETLKAATFFYLIGAIVGLFSRLYDQAKTDTSIDDFRLTEARLLAAPLYSGLAAIGGVVIVQRVILGNINLFDLNMANILIAAVFGLTPSLFTNAIQKEADQYKTDLKSTIAPTGDSE
jgi:hypothetical protein